ncbi:MAG TPA: hypothetical protein VJT82_07500 [Pyrinomonadaceae bacterium]|nr:hypothetical protein [Pyrinomonadaceae bacterium]
MVGEPPDFRDVEEKPDYSLRPRRASNSPAVPRRECSSGGARQSVEHIVSRLIHIVHEAEGTQLRFTLASELNIVFSLRREKSLLKLLKTEVLPVKLTTSLPESTLAEHDLLNYPAG